MRGSILAAVLLGLVLTPALGNFSQQTDDNCHVCAGGVYQNMTLSNHPPVAVIEQSGNELSWKTIWNYNTGVIVTKVMEENTCYISTMNRHEIPTFADLPRLASESRNMINLGTPKRKITFVTGGLVSNLNSYGADIINMCSGAITYQAYEVHGPQVNVGPCVTLDVLRVVQLKYCSSKGTSDQDDHQLIITGGQSQIVTIHSQWRVAVIQQTTSTGSWKTIWNYNTGIIATKVMQENTCYISTMNRTEMPSVENLPRLARESRNQLGLGRPRRKITFVTGGLVSNLNSYGADIINMCSGAITYQAYEVHGPQVNVGPCVTLDVLRVVELKYCNSNGFPNQPQQDDQNQQVIIGGQSQIVTIHSQWRVAVIQQTTSTGSWKTIWNYNTGVIATKVMQENTCYISTMKRNEMPSFENLPRLARESRNQLGLGRPRRKITFVTAGLVNKLQSYGADIFSMCKGVPTYQAYEVHRPQVNLGPCVTLDVLRVVELKYCNSNGTPGQPQQDNQNQQVIIGGQSQIVTIHSQWRVAVIQQTTSTGSWKTIWNYNTGIIATKVMQENTCYISTMKRNEMPSFENLPRLARESRNQLGLGRPRRKITFVTAGLVSNLQSYGADIFSMCKGVPTYQAYEVHMAAKVGSVTSWGLAFPFLALTGPQVNVGPCVTLDVLRVVELKYCNSSGFPNQPQQDNQNQQVIIGGQSQIVTIHSQWRVAVIQQTTSTGSWKTIWNYNTGIIATKVMQENTCYISTMKRNEMPSFENLPRLARESRNQLGLGRPRRKITFVTSGLVSNLQSYGADIFSMCKGVPTYQAYEVHRPQVNVGPCVTLDVLRVVELKYCNSNGIPDQPQQDDQNQQVIIGGQSQIVTIHSQWRVAVIQQTTSTGSWKTIWNYNTGVIATKVMQENTCYISTMNRTEMPSFENLPRLARESRNQLGLGRPRRKITFVTGGLVNNLQSYGADIFSMCKGVPTYQAYEVHRPQVNVGPCVTLDVLRVVELKYCNSNGIPEQDDQNQQVIIGGQSQIVTIHSQWRVAVIQQTTSTGSWKTIWNYNTGVIATKVMQENTCYISTMNRTEMPSFENLPRLARESRNQLGLGRFTRKITFVTGGLVSNLNSYGADIINMCSGAITYQAYEVHGPQVNVGPCVTLDVLRVVELKYCNSNGFPNQPQQDDQNQQVIIGGQSQIVTIHSQWRVAVIQQTTSTGSWKTIWNYNTGVIATKVMQENTCYISTMNRTEMPSFENLPRLARESRNQLGLGRFTRKITFVTGGLVSNLNSYGADIINMCSGAITYQAYEVHGPQVNVGPCVTLNVLRVVQLKYCNSNDQNDQSQQNNDNCQISVGGVYQNMSLSSQPPVAVIQQRSNQLSWKTIWNYNTGVIATKVIQDNTCYISTMNRSKMPTFDALVRVAAQNGNMIGLGRPTKKITFIAKGLVSNLQSYGANIINMCRGVPTYQAYEVQGPQVSLGSCTALDVMKVVELNYCHGRIMA
ncbi:uncharacterized protein [Pithys albifrons albifrons]|uniref:uncharacterized protein n=1 Tax=Pithys albifrons albifrons TaxID=3385563 RepID=UPI003A5D0029